MPRVTQVTGFGGLPGVDYSGNPVYHVIGGHESEAGFAASSTGVVTPPSGVLSVVQTWSASPLNILSASVASTTVPTATLTFLSFTANNTSPVFVVDSTDATKIRFSGSYVGFVVWMQVNWGGNATGYRLLHLRHDAAGVEAPGIRVRTESPVDASPFSYVGSFASANVGATYFKVALLQTSGLDMACTASIVAGVI